MSLYLQAIAEDIDLLDLNPLCRSYDFVSFSKTKKLYEYQQKALENSLKILCKFYYELSGSKEKFFELYSLYLNGKDFKLKLEKDIFIKLYGEFNIPVNDGVLSFKHLTNRMSFWMATGSGKTLIIVKLIDMLKFLMDNRIIPKKDILFLTPREDLIDQFKRHVEEFNSFQNTKIWLYSLKDFDKVKRQGELLYPTEIGVFYYRGDLIWDEQKEKILDFRNYENYGEWYIILDEAHKGDKEESKRQHIYNIMSRNGFLFNFSATFISPLDYITCVYNFNLAEFVKNGYGKHIYVSREDIQALGKREDFSGREKELILLKTLILYTLLKKAKEKVKDYYHHPLMVVLVNSVNTEDSDLELFFKELEKVAMGKVDENLFNSALSSLSSMEVEYEFEGEKFKLEDVKSIKVGDVLSAVFNSSSYGRIEVLKLPDNNQELVFKLSTSHRPFALIKIGDITRWIREKLSSYEIVEKFENESYFRNIEKSHDISILMGSRAFYEGWDSNRPNIVLFINIGKGKDAKKFVLQSVGRGVRIEPIGGHRRRLRELFVNNILDENVYNNLKEHAKYLETLFVFGTKAQNLREVIETLKEEKQELERTKIGPAVRVAKDKERVVGYKIAKEDFELLREYLNISDKVLLARFDRLTPSLLEKIKKVLKSDKIEVENNGKPVLNIDYHINRLVEYVEKVG